jgi:hypothetical protein
MKVLILILLLAVSAMGQQRNTRIDAVLPAPGTAGTVTISLSEYDRLVELASHKGKLPEGVPLPFVLRHRRIVARKRRSQNAADQQSDHS